MPPITLDPVALRIASDRIRDFEDGPTHPLDLPVQTVKGWRGHGGTIVLTKHIELDGYPDETFIADDIEIHAEPEVVSALRELQDTAAHLQERVWALEDESDRTVGRIREVLKHG